MLAPFRDFLERLGNELVDPAIADSLRAYEARRPETAQMLGYCGLRDGERRGQLLHGAIRLQEERQNLSPDGMHDCLKHGVR